ncbi:MAG: HPr family phosphocarrier protein [Victivallales bacterium]|jgi:phosphocarrier protein
MEMSSNYPCCSIQVSLENESSFHMRPAAVLVKIASNFESDVIIEYKGLKASCKSLLELIMLGINSMANFTVSAIGKDAQNAINAISDFFEGLMHDKDYEKSILDGNE